MRPGYSEIGGFKQRIQQKLKNVFNNPVAGSVKKVLITVVGTTVTLLGILLIILPGPAFLLIPVGLAILALEYPIARVWLRKCQRWMSISAKKVDKFFARRKAR